jgi:hypothetical protein
VRYQDGKRQRSAGIFPTKRRALAEKRAIDRGDRDQVPPPPVADLDPQKADTPFGEYVTTKVVARLEGPTPKLGVRHPQEGRKAHPAHLR